MQIQYFGQTGFLLRGSGTSVALALPSEKIGSADIVITADADEKVKVGAEQTVFDWPGEYEARGVGVSLIPVGREKPSRIAKIILEEVAIVHLDGVAEAFTEKEEERIGNADILLVNIGKGAALDAKQLKNMIEALEPQIVIPMNFVAGEEKEFAKAVGLGETEEEDVLKIKKSDLGGERVELKVLRPRK